jgi:hypothetical protein
VPPGPAVGGVDAPPLEDLVQGGGDGRRVWGRGGRVGRRGVRVVEGDTLALLFEVRQVGRLLAGLARLRQRELEGCDLCLQIPGAAQIGMARRGCSLRAAVLSSLVSGQASTDQTG